MIRETTTTVVTATCDKCGASRASRDASAEECANALRIAGWGDVTIGVHDEDLTCPRLVCPDCLDALKGMLGLKGGV